VEITDIRVRKVTVPGRLKGVASVTFDDCIVVHDIKIIEGTDKLFIAMPSRKTPDGEYKDIVHPINTETRERLQTAVVERFNKEEDHSPEL